MRAANSSQAGDSQRASAPVELGRVLRARGLDGGLLVSLHGGDPASLSAAREVVLVGEPGEVPFRVRRVAAAGRGRDGRARVALWLDGLRDRERAEHWCGATVQVASLAEAPDDELYWRDLLGARCLGPQGEELGTLEEIWPTPGHDVLVLRGPAGRRLVPAAEPILLRFDRERRELWLDPPEEDPAG
jgi:16S rRNA processing protein RimM